MNMFDEATAIRDILNMRSLTQNEIAKRMGVSQSYIANKLRLLNFSDGIRKLIIECGLCERQARLLLRIKDDRLTEIAIKKIRDMRLSVCATEALVDGIIEDERKKELNTLPSGDRVRKFEELIVHSANALSECGIKVRHSVEVYKNKKYITIFIEE